MNYIYKINNNNIGHFLHEELIPLWNFINNNEINKLIITNSCDFITSIIKIILPTSNIKCVTNLCQYSSYQTIEIKKNRLNFNKDHNSYKRIVLLREMIYNRYSIPLTIPVNYKILYTRSDCHRRRLLNYNEISNMFDIVIHNFSINFEEVVKLLSKSSHFVSLEGAAFTNVLAMNPLTKVLSIQVGSTNSWQKMFGTYKLVTDFNTDYIETTNLKKPELNI